MSKIRQQIELIDNAQNQSKIYKDACQIKNRHCYLIIKQ